MQVQPDAGPAETVAGPPAAAAGAGPAVPAGDVAAVPGDLFALTEQAWGQLDADGIVVAADERLAALLRTTVPALLGRHGSELIAVGERGRFTADLADLVAGRVEVLRSERPLRASDGAEVWVRIAARRDLDRTSQAWRVTLVLTDLTEHHHHRTALAAASVELAEANAQLIAANAGLAAANARLEGAQRLAGLGWWERDLATDRLTWSPLLYELFGVDPDTFTPSLPAFRTMVPEADLDLVRAADTEVLRTGSSETTHRIVRRDGEERIVHVLLQLQTAADGTPQGVHGTMRDVTADARLDQQLRDREELLQRVLAATNDGWWDVDFVAGTAFFADRWWEILAVPPEDRTATPLTWREYSHPEDLPRFDVELAAVAAARRRTYRLEGRMVRHDGQTVTVVVRGLVDYGDHAPVRVSGVLTDVTELRQAEVAKERFLSTVSHELRTPLTSIGGALELIDAGVAGPLSAQVTTLVEVARRNTDRLRALIDDLLDIERLRTRQRPLHLTTEPLGPLLARAVADLAPFAATHATRFVAVGPPCDAVVRVEAARIVQVLANLLSNAAKFAPPGTDVEVRTRTDQGRVRVEVVDVGPGVPPEVGAAVFDRFVQADPSDRRSHGGTGLGLAISREIVHQHGGEIGFDTAPGRTCFWFELPVVG